MVPYDPNKPYDMHEVFLRNCSAPKELQYSDSTVLLLVLALLFFLQVIDKIVDDSNFFEIMPDYARNLIVGFARMEGVSRPSHFKPYSFFFKNEKLIFELTCLHSAGDILEYSRHCRQ